MIFNTVYPGKGGVDLSDIDISVNGSWPSWGVMDAYVSDTNADNHPISNGQKFTFQNQNISGNPRRFQIILDDVTGLRASITLRYSEDEGGFSIIFEIPENFTQG